MKFSVDFNFFVCKVERKGVQIYAKHSYLLIKNIDSLVYNQLFKVAM